MESASMSAIDLKITKDKVRQQLNQVHGIDELREELSVFKLDNAPLGIQEIFKSAPKQHLIPNELLIWMEQLIFECQNYGLSPHDIIVCIRTIGISNGYSSQQVMETLDKAVKEYDKSDKKINSDIAKLITN